MLHFIPAWYQQNSWCENEQYWYARRTRTEFDDTVKHIQLFHRSQAYPFQVMLLSYAPNFRHFLHRQSVFHAPYWSCFDAIQEIKKKKVRMFSFHNLRWPEHVEFVYSPFALVAMLNKEKYAQVEFGEDGNLIMIDLYEHGKITRRNIYDDRGIVSSTILFENEKPVYQDYLNMKGVWKIRHYYIDGHVEVNPKIKTYLIEYGGQDDTKKFRKSTYASLEEVIAEVLATYLTYLDNRDMFCVAMHPLHTHLLQNALKDRRKILSFYENRIDIETHKDVKTMTESADYIITDVQDNLKRIQKTVSKELNNIIDITPFDSRVDFGISQQLNVQKILVPIDGLDEIKFEELIINLAKYLPENENARIHLFTRVADYNRKKILLEQVRGILRKENLCEAWADDERVGGTAENMLDAMDAEPIRFVVEQCVDELSVSKCMREQRLIVDMRTSAELYLRIAAISVGIPQIVYKDTQFVEHKKNGLVIKDFGQIAKGISYYLDGLTNWNEAMVYSFELGKKYTTRELIERWKEVISFVGEDSSFTAGD